MNEQAVVQLEANIDDMDPRLWPSVIDALLSAGALDAWATPIVMKKGRPAFTLAALCEPSGTGAVRRAFFEQTTTIGVREYDVRRHVLDRRIDQVEVEGQTIGIKIASDGEHELNRSVEWDDVVAAAAALDMAPKQVLAAATAAAVAKR